MLLKIHIDAPQKHPVEADVVLIGASRGVGGNQQNLVPGVHQGCCERVVAQAAAAVHVARARGDVGYPHNPALIAEAVKYAILGPDDKRTLRRGRRSG